MTRRRPPAVTVQAKSARSAPPPRVRRTAERACADILDAAERQLIEGGPDALRLQQVAAEVGVSHPTVLHHFGSREALVLAVVQRALSSLQAQVVTAIAEVAARDPHPPEEPDVTRLIEGVAAALGDRGQGRALAWLALSGRATPGHGLGIRAAAEASHAVRKKRRRARTPPLEDTLFTLQLAFYALFAQSVIGPLVEVGAVRGDGERAAARFRKWLARVIQRHLESGGAADE